jgi:diguanylate cyclase (GGDEF)-like protein
MGVPSTENQTDFETLNIYGNLQRIRRIYLLFGLVTLCGFIIGMIILGLHGDWLQVAFMGTSSLVVLVCFPLILKNKFELATIVLALVLFSLITLISTYGLGIHAITNLGFPAILILASLVIRKRTLALIFAYAVVCVAWLVFGELLDLYQPTILVRSVPGDFFTVLVILICTAIMVRLLTESLFTSHREVRQELNERKRVEERLAYDALHDALTGLPNRTLFLDRLNQKFEHARRHPDSLFAVLYLDLDRFKVVNDSLGHAVGDQLLIETARRLSRCLRPEDTVARLSGDEFAILMDDFRVIGNAVHAAERIQSELASTSMIAGVNRATTASIGITVYNHRYLTPHEMLRDADSAMYRAKAKGGRQYAVFDDSMHDSAMALLRLEADLKRAVENQEWQVYYQPIVTLPGREIICVEALVRWLHPQRGIIEPTEFIQVAEETGLILPMGEYVLRQACNQVKVWRENKHPGLMLSVNLSGRQFQSQDLLKMIEKVMNETGYAGEGLEMEITESVAMKDFAYSETIMRSLQALGIQIALDDFGNGYSSLGYLNRFPIRVLKIDQAFIKGIGYGRNSETITRAIISMGHALDMQVVAEGVETQKQLRFLQSNACDRVQGYLVSHPLPAEQLEALL